MQSVVFFPMNFFLHTLKICKLKEEVFKNNRTLDGDGNMDSLKKNVLTDAHACKSMY